MSFYSLFSLVKGIIFNKLAYYSLLWLPLLVWFSVLFYIFFEEMISKRALNRVNEIKVGIKILKPSLFSSSLRRNCYSFRINSYN